MISYRENIDYLAEVIVSHMAANKKIDDNNLIVHLTGVFKRFFSKEVERIRFHKNQQEQDEWNIYIHREGMYDILPEGFFHSHSGKFFKTKKETLKEFARHRQEEKAARQFFLPLEQEFFKYRINKEQFEQDFFYSPEAIEEFVDFFNLNQLELNSYQKSALFFIVPHIPYIAGNLDLTQTCFEIILQESVSIETIYLPMEIKNDFENPALSKSTLDIDTLLGNTCMDYNPHLKITVGPLLNSNSLINFLAGRKKKVLDRLIELFIQADMNIITEYLLKDEDADFILNEEQYSSRLNYSTTI